MGAPTEAAISTMVAHDPAPAASPSAKVIRVWARENGWTVSDRGRIPDEVRRAYEKGA